MPLAKLSVPIAMEIVAFFYPSLNKPLRWHFPLPPLSALTTKLDRIWNRFVLRELLLLGSKRSSYSFGQMQLNLINRNPASETVSMFISMGSHQLILCAECQVIPKRQFKWDEMNLSSVSFPIKFACNTHLSDVDDQ